MSSDEFEAFVAHAGLDARWVRSIASCLRLQWRLDWSETGLTEGAMKRVGAYDAKTNLGRLLDEVAAGETITITRHGVPVAVLSPPGPDRRTADAAATGLRAFRATHRLAGLSIRELIEEGRRR